MGVYDSFVKTATSMIAQYGEKCVINSVIDSSVADPDKPWDEANPNVPVPHANIPVAFFPLDEKQRKVVQAMDGPPTGYQSAYIAKLPFQLGLKDYIVRKSGAICKVVSFDVIDPNGEGIILYIVLVKT